METKCLGCLERSPDVKILSLEDAAGIYSNTAQHTCEQHTKLLEVFCKAKPEAISEVLQKHMDVAHEFIHDAISWYNFNESTESSGGSIMDLMQETIESEDSDHGE